MWRSRSEASFDPECAEAAANMSLNSTKSFDPEHLHFEDTRASLGYAHGGLDHGAPHGGSDDVPSQDSDASFDPEAVRKEGSLSSQQSFDAEAGGQRWLQAASQLQSGGAAHGGTARSMSSEASFDAEAGAQSPSSQTSQASLDPESQEASPARRASPSSEMSFGSAVSYDPQESVVDGDPGRTPLDIRP